MEQHRRHTDPTRLLPAACWLAVPRLEGAEGFAHLAPRGVSRPLARQKPFPISLMVVLDCCPAVCEAAWNIRGCCLPLGTLPLLNLPHASPSYAATHTARPNVALILAEGLGFSGLGCYGSEIATPNLDRLASSGIRFTQYYTTPRCCPSRAALLTGHYPHQAGMGAMLEDRGLPGYRGELSDRCITIAEEMRPTGAARAACRTPAPAAKRKQNGGHDAARAAPQRQGTASRENRARTQASSSGS